MSELLTESGELSYPALLRRRALTEPDAVAIRQPAIEELRYGEWFDRARAFAGRLRDAGHGRGARVGLLFNNAAYCEYAIAALGVLFVGAAVAPLSRALTDAELARLTRRARLDVVVHGSELEAPDADLPTIAFALPTAVEDRSFDTEPEGDALAEILFTSGTTGEPKPIAVTHRGLASELPVDDSSPPRDEVLLHAVPLGTNWAQAMLRRTLARRVTTVVMDRFDAEEAVALIAAEGATELALSPAMAGLLLSADASEHDLSRLRQISLSSAPASAALLEGLRQRFPAATIASFYSSTEACPAQAELLVPPDPVSAVGRASAGSELRIVDEQGAALPAGRLGTVQLRSVAGVHRNYLDGGPVCDDDGWVATGDVGRLDGDGLLTLVGRAAEVVNFGGVKIHCGEVEAVLQGHPRVRDAAAFGIAAPIVGEELAAALVCDGPVSDHELVSFARERLAAHKLPTRLTRVARLPRTAAGKVDKAELRRWTTARGAERRTAGAAPTGDLERHLLELWRDVLGDEALEARDPLLDRGASSLAAFVVLSRMRQRLELEVRASAFLRCGTVSEQARLFAQAAGAAS